MSDTPIFLFLIVFLAVLAHHLWHRHERLLALVPTVLAFELLRMHFPVVAHAFTRLEQAVGVTPATTGALAGGLVFLLISCYGLKRMFVPKSKPRSHRRAAGAQERAQK